MIVLQILLLPGVVLFLLIGTFVIGSTGVEHSGSSARTVQDVAMIEELNPIWTTESICLSYQSHGSPEIDMEQVSVIQTEINQSNPLWESQSKFPIYKLSR
jgi:hypothetical protein